MWRPSYRSAAATHSTPGRVIAPRSKPEPCIPMPIIPKRTRSLGATALVCAAAFGSSRMCLVATSAPAAVAPLCKNALRETLMSSLLYEHSLAHFIRIQSLLHKELMTGSDLKHRRKYITKIGTGGRWNGTELLGLA